MVHEILADWFRVNLSGNKQKKKSMLSLRLIYVTVLIISRGNPPLCAVWTANNYRYWKEFKENELPLLWTSCFYLLFSTSVGIARFCHSSSQCQDFHAKHSFCSWSSLHSIITHPHLLPGKKRFKKKRNLILQKIWTLTSLAVQFLRWEDKRNKWSREKTSQLPWYSRPSVSVELTLRSLKRRRKKMVNQSLLQAFVLGKRLIKQSK